MFSILDSPSHTTLAHAKKCIAEGLIDIEDIIAYLKPEEEKETTENV